ncbi:unnamed protein product [Lota lota]
MKKRRELQCNSSQDARQTHRLQAASSDKAPPLPPIVAPVTPPVPWWEWESVNECTAKRGQWRIRTGGASQWENLPAWVNFALAGEQTPSRSTRVRLDSTQLFTTIHIWKTVLPSLVAISTTSCLD